jgi:PAS domain S-box-containing protein
MIANNHPSQVDAALQESQAKLAAALASMTDAVLISDVNGHFIDFNDAFVSFNRFRRKEECSRSLAEYPAFLDVLTASGEIAPLKQWAVFRALRGETVKNAEYILRRKDTGEMWMASFSFAPIRNEFGGIVGSIVVGRDITHSKRAEEALVASEARFRILVETAPEAIFIRTNELFTYLNAAALRLFGASCAADLLGHLVLDRFSPEHRERVWKRMQMLDEQGLSTFSADQVFLRLDGSPVQVLVSAVPFIYQNQPCALVFARDITERKRAEDALRQSEERFTSIFDSSPVATSLSTIREGRYLNVNNAFLEMFQRERNEVVGHTVFELNTWVDLRQRDALFEEFKRGGAVINFEMDLRTKAGQVIQLLWSGAKVEINGEACLLGSGLDITERKRAEAALRESEAQFRATFNQAAVGMAQVNLDGRWLRVNQRLCDIVGHPREELLQKTFQEITHPDDLVTDLDFVRQLLAGEIQTYTMEKRYLRKDGSVVPVNLTVSLVREPSGAPRHFISVVEDLTERKRLELEQRALEVQLRQQQKLEAIGTLAGGVAHEINNPINGIMNYAQLIQDRLPPGSPLNEYTGEILRETERVATIVRNLLTFARDEKQHHSPARVGDILDGTLSLLRTIIRHDQITLQVFLPEGLPLLRCRSQQIQQVLMNLLTNARDALNERYPGYDPDKTLSVSVSLFQREGQDWLRVSVEDHGIGIAPTVRERMFDPFYTTKSRDRGTGLGLAISHGIVKEHHGFLTVESEPGRFTIMHLDLPTGNGPGSPSSD